jgi:hypothetical protein
MKPVGSYLMFLKEPEPVIVWFCIEKKKNWNRRFSLVRKKDNP